MWGVRVCWGGVIMCLVLTTTTAVTNFTSTNAINNPATAAIHLTTTAATTTTTTTAATVTVTTAATTTTAAFTNANSAPATTIAPPTDQREGVRLSEVSGRLEGSSSRPVAPIEPLLELGGGGLAPPGPLQPVFDEAAPRSVSSLTGGTAYLHCVVHHLGGGSVSWIRRRDLHILTVGTYTYTTDQRFEAVHAAASRDWILKLRYAQERDSGLYDCQVSRRPVLTFTVRLDVYAAPRASIVGAPDMHVDCGSTINLTCTVTHSPEPPAYIFWYHNGQVVNYESPRGGVTVVTERGNTTRGFLLIQHARPQDSGNYTCAPSNTAPSALRVHVLNGDPPAAMQTSAGVALPPMSCPLLRFLSSLLLAWAWGPPVSSRGH